MKYFRSLPVRGSAPIVLKPIIRYTSLFSVAVGLMFFAGCSTKKKNFMSRGFHNLTAKYNVYWNGQESMKEGVKALAKGHADDYEEILDVFPVGSAESAKSVYTQMDRSIEKASIAINKHSMLFKGKEYVSTIDDAYMLIGKAHFYKRDFVQALEMFTYVIKQYKKNKIRFDGYLWLIRTDTELARFKDGEKIITKLEEEKAFPKKKRAELAAVKADYYIKKGEYDSAKDQLIVAINATKKRKSKSRYTYILAQLYEELSNRDSAAYYYTRVLKKNVSYEMEFNARINRALLTSAKSGNLLAIKRELNKMAKDDKNADLLDRIYFALGNIALEEGEKDLALEHLKKSVAASTKNFNQKAISYFTIADLYFEKPEYELASAYYDSSLTILPMKNEDYGRVQALQQSLAELVKNIRIIAYQDSMLRLGNMSESELDALVAEIIEEEKLAQAQEEEQVESGLNQQQLNQLNQNQNNGLSTSGTGWYFYNTTALSFGANDFRQRWGDRVRADNWRRKSKQSTSIIEIENEDGDTTEVTADQLLDPSFYKKNIPRTEAQRDSANQKVQYAYYDLGTIYKEQLSENQVSIQTFEKLLKRYPKGLSTLETYFQLYRLYKEEGNQARSKYYADKLLREYPDSEYAKMLRDPKYLEKLEALKGRLGKMYSMAFANFSQGEYERVIEAADSALTKFDDEDILSKFALLKVMAIGATERLKVYRAALEAFIAKYTAAPEKPRAEELLAYVKTLMGETVPDEEVVEETDSIPEAIYTFNFDINHYYMMVATDLPDMAEMKGRLSNFNATMFSIETLTIKNLKFSPTQDLLFVQGFKETKKAMDYYNAILADTTVFAGIDLQKTDQFIISQENFGKFYQEKQVPLYMEFFEKEYLKED
ncbi:MAG: tetratricopeptide repeat protein [Flavobacteriales bacterium]|nr:tetratricopeptide repeat protein [Flavobacteriales bacterium]